MIDESTHKQLINGIKVAIDILNDVTEKQPCRLNYEQSEALAQLIKLRQLAIAQAKLAGITFEEMVK